MKNIFTKVGLVQIAKPSNRWSLGYSPDKSILCNSLFRDDGISSLYNTGEVIYIKFMKPHNKPTQFVPSNKETYKLEELEAMITFGINKPKLSPELDTLSKAVVRIKTYTEYAVEMHDVDAAMTTLGAVYLNTEENFLDVNDAAETLCKKNHDYLFGGNHVDYSSEGVTGRKRISTYNCFGRIIEQKDEGESTFKDSDFYQMNE